MLGDCVSSPVIRHSFDPAGAGRRAIEPDPEPSRASGGLVPPSRAGQSFSEIVLASPSEFPYSTSSHGGVAQLGERLTGSQEVRGSIPLVSTRALNEAPTQVGAFFHIGTQGQRRHHATSLDGNEKDRPLNEHPSHGSIFRRGELSRSSLLRLCDFITYKGSWRNG